MGGRSWLSCGLFVLGLWCINSSWVQPLECSPAVLPPGVSEILSSRQHGFTITSKSSQFLHSYWLLHFEAAPFLGSSRLQLSAWVPVPPHASELILEFKDHERDLQRILLDTFPIIFSSYESEGGVLLEIYCLLVYWMEVVPNLLAEKSVSTEVPGAILRECSRTQDKRDAVLLFVSSSYAQPSLFHLPYVQEPFIPDVEQLLLNPNHQEVDHDQVHLPTQKLCHLQDQKVNLYRASWGQCIVAPKTFSFPSCQGNCLALNSELLHSNFECYKREAPTCSRLFQICSPIKVRLFSLMVQDDEHNMSVHYMNTSIVEKCGCS
ncbi:nodal-like [Alexandromys fortis]|uniref:nodal-like n=1 Tax=Alexandromys fortis TaxID=100897 RepID=UPI00215385B6|nr:nodal-like [Microtus fortis]